MNQTRVFHLSNLAAGQEFDLAVAEGSDVLAAAQAHLQESGLTDEARQGFYLSVYPRNPEGDAPTTTQQTGAAATDGADPDGGLDAAILA